jgi:hypothetical protein
MLTVSYLSFNFYLICWLYYICHSTSIWYPDCIISLIPLPSDMLTVSYLSFNDGSAMTDIIHSTYQMEVEWQIWYSQPIRWKWNDRYDIVNTSDGSGMTYDTVSDMLTVLYLSFHFHLISWLYYICHSTSIWYADIIHSTYQMEVEWQIWYSQHIRWKWNDIWYSQPIKWK